MAWEPNNSGKITDIAAETKEIELHIHNHERWFGIAAVPSAEVHRADRMSGTILPFQLIAGNNAFGDWVEVLGSNDTPIKAENNFFDFHRILVTNTNSTNTFIIQFIIGESSDFAAKLLAGNYNEIPYKAATNNNDSGVGDLIAYRHNSGEKVWMRCADVGGNGTNINLYFGIHEYPV